MDADEVTADLIAMHERLCRYVKDATEEWWKALNGIDAEICRVLNGIQGGRLR